MSSKQSRTYFHFQRAAAHLQRVADSALQEAAGITAAQGAVLTIIESLGAAKQKQLAEILDQNESAVTQMISKLERQGLVERTHSSEDRRVKEVKCTPAGKDVRKRARIAFDHVNQRLDQALELDGEDFLDQLQRIRKIDLKP